MFERAIKDGFRLAHPNQPLETKFYIVDQPNLEDSIASAKRSKNVDQILNAALIGAAGVSATSMLVAIYQLVAIMTGLPNVPWPF